MKLRRLLLAVTGMLVVGWLARAALGVFWFRREISNASAGKNPVMPPPAPE